jgi:hypothetical protein
MGLPLELQNLIILTFAAGTNRRFTLHGGPYEPSTDTMPDELELKEQALPSAHDWGVALQRASSLFGLTLGQTLNAANVGKLVADVRQKASEKRDAVLRLVAQIRDRSGRYAAGAQSLRQQTAESAQALVAAIAQASDEELVSTLAHASLMSSEAAVGRTLGQASACAEALTHGQWPLFDAIKGLADHRRDAAQTIMTRLTEALVSDEHVLPLKAKLEELGRDAMALLATAAPAVPVTTPPIDPGVPPLQVPVVLPVPPAPGNELVAEQQQMHLTGSEALAELEKLKARVASERDLELTLSWRLERKGTQP